MGRSDPPVGPHRRGGVATGRVLLGIAAALVIVGSYELGRRSAVSSPRAPASPVAAMPATVRPATAAVAPTAVPQSTEELLAAFERARPSPREERAGMEVTASRPEPTPAAQPPGPEATVPPETPHEKMARCLTFRVENDEIHYAGYAPGVLPMKVTASNACPFSFEGPSVSVEVRAIPSYGEGTIVRVVGNFQEPIPSRGRSETQIVIACPRCDQVAHRFEARLLP